MITQGKTMKKLILLALLATTTILNAGSNQECKAMQAQANDNRAKLNLYVKYEEKTMARHYLALLRTSTIGMIPACNHLDSATKKGIKKFVDSEIPELDRLDKLLKKSERLKKKMK